MRFIKSLRARLILLVLLAVIPALIVIAFAGIQQRNLARQLAEEQTDQYIRSASAAHEALIEGGRQMLISLGESPLLEMAPEECSERLSLVHSHLPQYTILMLLNLNGQPRCSSLPEGLGLQLSDRDYFQLALSTGDFVVGETVTGRLTSRIVTPLAYPLENEQGEIKGVLVATIGTDWVTSFYDSLDLPPGSAVMIVNEEGVVLARIPETERWVGQQLPNVPIIRTILESPGAGQAEVEGIDGVQRIYAFWPLTSVEERPIYISAGIPSSSVYAQADQTNQRSLFFMAVSALIALAAAWFGGELFFLRVVSLTAERDAAEAQLRETNIGLERRVAERTADLEQELGERKRAELLAEQRAREAEEGQRILEALMAFVPEGVAIVGSAGGPVRMVSRYGLEMTGHEVTDDSPLLLGQLYHLDGETPAAHEEIPLYRAALKGEVIQNEEWLLVRSGQPTIYVLSNAGPIADLNGNVVGGVMTWADATDLREATAALEENARSLERSNRELQDFAYITSHDLQEPLRKIQAFGDRLIKNHSAGLDEQGQDYIRRMTMAATRMQNMINDLLAYSRVATRGTEFNRVDLSEALQEALNVLELRIRQTGARVQVGSMAVVEGDQTQIIQLFQNLLANAIKFARFGEPPQIEVRAQIMRPSVNSPAQAVVTIRDHGIGFDQKYAERIFQPFQRLNARDQFEGSGIGLAIVKRIVDRHHGTISVSSAPGEGACFEISLPVRQPRKGN